MIEQSTVMPYLDDGWDWPYLEDEEQEEEWPEREDDDE